MSTTTTNDDELIIISSDSTENDFNFDFESSFSENKEIDGLITLDENKTSLEKDKVDINLWDDFSFSFDDTPSEEPKKSEKVELEKKEELDINENLFEINENETLFTDKKEPTTNNLIQDIKQEDKKETLKENIIEENNILEEKSNKIEEPIVKETIEQVDFILDRNDILSEAISKLEKRKEVLVWEKSKKQQSVKDIKEQILKLEQKVKELEQEISSFELEENGILKDILSIEKMKAWEVIEEKTSKKK